MNQIARALAVAAILAFAGEALGSQCATQTLDEQIERVNTIVFAVLIEAHIVDEAFQRASATFRVHEVLKGTVDNEFVLTTSADFGVGTGIGLLIGMHYLLFFNSDINGISSCGGSGRATVARVEEVRQRISGN